MCRAGGPGGSGRSGFGLRVPASGRAGDIDGIVGLLDRHEVLYRQLGGGERLGVEPLGDFIPLAAGVGIALRSGEAEPLERLDHILFDADPARIKNAEIELAVGDPALGGSAEPLRGAAVVGAPAAAV